MTKSGKLILIIGTSSSGKSTLATALQSKLDGHWLLTGIDQFFRWSILYGAVGKTAR